MGRGRAAGEPTGPGHLEGVAAGPWRQSSPACRPRPRSRPFPRCRDTAPPPAAAHGIRARLATAASPSTGQRACVVARKGSHAQALVLPHLRPRRSRRLPEVEVRLELVSGRVYGAVAWSRVQPGRLDAYLAWSCSSASFLLEDPEQAPFVLSPSVSSFSPAGGNVISKGLGESTLLPGDLGHPEGRAAVWCSRFCGSADFPRKTTPGAACGWPTVSGWTPAARACGTRPLSTSTSAPNTSRKTALSWWESGGSFCQPTSGQVVREASEQWVKWGSSWPW